MPRLAFDMVILKKLYLTAARSPLFVKLTPLAGSFVREAVLACEPAVIAQAA